MNIRLYECSAGGRIGSFVTWLSCFYMVIEYIRLE